VDATFFGEDSTMNHNNNNQTGAPNHNQRNQQ
jgi:hypothetical protein